MILLTGGAGYIGTHILVQLLQAGYEVVVVDNLSNSCQQSLDRVKELTDGDFTFYNFDLSDRVELERVFSQHPIDTVLHLAGSKAVGESVRQPLQYYKNNVGSSLVLLEVMQSHNCNRLVFSSSATVYGDAKPPVTEQSPTSKCTNPYGTTKLMIEYILQDLCTANPQFSAIALRYFNPIGAHPSGQIGENPKEFNNLLPIVIQVAAGKREFVSVFGTDFPTHDGTGVRDYVHVDDLARAHVLSIKLATKGFTPINLGTGVGTSVLELIDAVKKASGKEIPIRFTERRPGDVAEIYANCKRAELLLGWKAEKSLADMCTDSWRASLLTKT